MKILLVPNPAKYTVFSYLSNNYVFILQNTANVSQTS
jgi:hypothetical protein